MGHLVKTYKFYLFLRSLEIGGEKNMYWVTGILGLTLAAAPFIFGYTNHTAVAWISLILGTTTAIVSLYEGLGHKTDRWEYWVAMVAGIVAVIAPFAFGFGAITAALWTTVAVGLLLAGASAAKLFYGKPEFR
jgi:uncharacterized membrane protein HdeD (DUF308 family)